MNIILFQPDEVELPLPRTDPRATHLLRILRLDTGGLFDAGLIDGPVGKGRIDSIHPDALHLSFAWASTSIPSYPIHLLIGLPRPQTARDILRDGTALGVENFLFVPTEKSEAGYAQSNLWKSGEWRKCVINGMSQAFATIEPKVLHPASLESACASLPPAWSRVALDNYESPGSLDALPLPRHLPVVAAFGAERGWSAHERGILRKHGFQFAHLGGRVLRTETAATVAITLLRAKLGLF